MLHQQLRGNSLGNGHNEFIEALNTIPQMTAPVQIMTLKDHNDFGTQKVKLWFIESFGISQPVSC